MSDAFEREVESIGGAADALAAAQAAPPPAGLAGRLLDGARASRAPGRPVDLGPLPSGQQLFRAQVERLVERCAELTPEQWQATVEPYPWSVHGIVAHLLEVERHAAAVLGLGGDPDPAPGLDHIAMTEPTVDREMARTPEATFADWRDAAALVASHPGGRDDVSYHGLALSAETVLVLRAFEVWTHTDDINRAVGSALFDPPAEEVRRMASLSVRSMTFAATRPARVVLTGEGGGTWVIGTNGHDEPEALLLVADALDYCRFAARRLGRAELDAAIRGDADLAERLLTTARSFAM